MQKKKKKTILNYIYYYKFLAALKQMISVMSEEFNLALKHLSENSVSFTWLHMLLCDAVSQFHS